MEKPVLDVKDIQAFLGCGKMQAYELCNSGAFHTVKIGKRIKISREAFMSWFNGKTA